MRFYFLFPRIIFGIRLGISFSDHEARRWFSRRAPVAPPASRLPAVLPAVTVTVSTAGSRPPPLAHHVVQQHHVGAVRLPLPART